MAAWSEGADAPAKIRAFSQSGIRLKKGASVPTHTALAALDDWLAADGDPAVVAEARDRLSRTPGAVAVVSAESYADRFAPGEATLIGIAVDRKARLVKAHRIEKV